jgi:hypothetical protein
LKTKTQIARFLASIQLIFSILIAAAIIYGYMNYRSSLGQFIQALATSINSVSNVVGVTAETIETKQSIVTSTKQTLIASRALLKELNAAALNQTRQAPQLAESIRASSLLAARLSDTLNSVGDGLMLLVPTGLEMQGFRPIVVMTRPLKNHGLLLMEDAQNIKKFGNGLLALSGTIGNDGARLGAAFVVTGENALRLLDETEKTLDGLQENELPKALQAMKSASENLRKISQRISVTEDISMAFLIFGLLLSGWCFLNSLSHLLTINLHAGTASIPVVPQPRIDSLPSRSET